VRRLSADEWSLHDRRVMFVTLDAGLPSPRVTQNVHEAAASWQDLTRRVTLMTFERQRVTPKRRPNW